MVEVASFTVGVDVDLKSVNRETAQLKQGMDTAARATQTMGNETAKIQRVSQQAAAGLKEMNKAKQEAINGAANLGRFMRVLTTDLFGVNVAAIALGTALGNLATQFVSRVIVAIIQGTTVFARMRNELALISGGMIDVGRDFNMLDRIARTSNRSLEELTADWTSLRRTITASGGDIDEARKHFEAFNRTLSEVQDRTIMQSAQGAATAFGRVIIGLDSVFRISNLLVGTFDLISKALNKIADALPKQKNPLQEQLDILARIRSEASIINLYIQRGKLNVEEMAMAEKQLLDMKNQQAQVYQKIVELQKHDPETKARRDETLRAFNDDAQHVIDNFRNSPLKQEIENRKKQVLDSLRQFGAVGAKELEAISAQATAAVIAQQFQPLRESLQSAEGAERDHYMRRLETIKLFGPALGASEAEVNQFLEIEQLRHWTTMKQIQLQAQSHMFQATQRTGSAIVNVFQQLGQKSKTWAIASLLVSTALNAQRVIQSTAAAVMAVYADPTVPFAAKPGIAAGVAALGKIELAAVIASGVLQIGGAIKGSGSAGGGGSGGGGGSAVIPEEEQPRDLGRAVTIYMSRGALYSHEEVQELMMRMGEEVKNGATLVSTKILPS